MTEDFTWINQENQEIRKYEAAICFARMWGVMETLEEFPNIGFQRVRDMVMALAEEFAAEKKSDPAVFFLQKMKENQTQYIDYT